MTEQGELVEQLYRASHGDIELLGAITTPGPTVNSVPLCHQRGPTESGGIWTVELDHQELREATF